MINLGELQEKHKKYEGVIIVKFHEIDREERIVKKSTALIVEVAELANEKEGFFKFFKIKKRNSKKKQLKEAADCLAYFLGLANELELTFNEPNIERINKTTKESNKHFKDTVREMSYIDYGQKQDFIRICILKSFGNYLMFLNSLGLDFEEVKETYLNYVLQDNIKRQEENY